MPHFTYFTSHSKEPVTSESPIWEQPLPLRLDALAKNEEGSVSHADYFQAARAFLESNSCGAIARAISRELQLEVSAADIEEVRICLEKHGEFYHPARIETTADQELFCFVLNVAISATGLQFIEKEYQLLNRLNSELALDYLPRAYAYDRITGLHGQKFAMLLGQWFDGFYEFHYSIDPSDRRLKLLVWDDTRGRYFLSAEQTRTLYAQASRILTAYYNLESFEQIFSWHHAAGDFIVKADDETLELKLVTVRRYAAILEKPIDAQPQKNSPQQILQALLIFFLNLSLHMRMDRLDGIGEMVWSDSLAVEATLVGFLDALSTKPDVSSLPDSPLACFMAYLMSFSQTSLLDLCESIVKQYNPKMAGRAVIQQNISRHVADLQASIRQILTI